ncbi:major facilitator superfamily domain-containing protein [Lentinula lateritia]|uniref:Major facilitator superfamily domain-containing protein n=1 Tax=Lentinula lateritia TaxID=40482 RepID=A0ABQ8UZQ6_9AGAR|nr:major facilitator superfamily domain-containing protein [Lentinula lateritia]
MSISRNDLSASSSSSSSSSPTATAAPIPRNQDLSESTNSGQQSLQADKIAQEPLTDEKTNDQRAQEPYSIYTRNEKWFLVMLIAISGLFSPLTANVYFPAIPAIAGAFHKSTELINLTITMYMIFQGISPMLFGTLADNVGRRIIYASCLLILSLTCVGLALIPTSAYWLLLLLRCLQSTGSASTIALGAGVIGDIAEAHERGGFFGVYQSGPLLAPAIGPVIGGALAGTLGWRSIFWFLCISSGVAFLVVIIFLPETLRSIVGNGSLPTTSSILHQPLIRIVGRGRAGGSSRSKSESNQPQPPSRKRKPFKNPFGILLHNPDITLILFFNGTVNAVYYAVTATISTLFASAYPQLGETEVGLCFLAIGGGMFLGSLTSGKVLDWEFGRIQKEVVKEKGRGKGIERGEGEEQKKTGRYDEDFPIEKARLRLIPFFMIFFVGANLGYGWSIQRKVHISIPLILQFIVGFIAIIVMNADATFVIDLMPEQSSSVSACNNLFRGTSGALLVSVIDLIANALDGPGWTFILLGGVCAVMTPMVYVVMQIGPGWRIRRAIRAGK